MDLADLLDVELQLLRDHDVARDELRRRDRRIGLALGAGERAEAASPAARKALVRDWVRAVQREPGAGHEGLGAGIVRAYEALGWLLVLVGLASGAGAAASVLAYDGTRPVNVVHFLALFVGLQLVLLALFLLSATLWRLRGRIPLFDVVSALLRLGFDGISRLFERRLGAERRALLRAARGRLRATQIIYGDAEHWLLVSFAQRFGLSFNLGALATCLYLVAFSDLAFCWETTLRVTPEGFHRLIAVLAAPWSWVYPDGLPGLDVVRASRYFRLDGTFGAGAAPLARTPELLGQWWRFLVLALICYGLVPRLTLTIVARVKLTRALASLRLDHGEIAALLERLSAPLVETRATLPEEAGAAAPVPAVTPEPVAGRSRASAVVWGDVPIDGAAVAALLADRFGWRLGVLAAAGAEDTAADEAAIRAVAADAGDDAVVVLAEAFEAPARETRAFLAALRAALGPRRAIVVGLLDGPAGRWTAPGLDDRRVWEQHLAGLGNPYLRVAALVGDG